MLAARTPARPLFVAALRAQQLQQVRKMEADLEAALASAEAAGVLGETVVRVQLRLGELLEQQPQPGYLAALLEALREVDARFADAIEASLLETKAQQLAVAVCDKHDVDSLLFHGRGGTVGPPGKAVSRGYSHDARQAAALWLLSEMACGITFGDGAW